MKWLRGGLIVVLFSGLILPDIARAMPHFSEPKHPAIAFRPSDAMCGIKTKPPCHTLITHDLRLGTVPTDLFKSFFSLILDDTASVGTFPTDAYTSFIPAELEKPPTILA